MKPNGGPNRPPAEKLADELWLAEKFQSNTAIAGSPRNSFRASVEDEGSGGRALNSRWPRQGVLNKIKLRMPLDILGSQTVGDKVHGQKGNSPDHQLRSQNVPLSGKGCGDAQTTRRLA